jgi:hypothetical protein
MYVIGGVVLMPFTLYQTSSGKPVTRHRRKQAPYNKPTQQLNIEVGVV